MVALATAQGNGNAAAVDVISPGHLYKSHLRTLFVWGTWDSATVKLQMTPDGTTWFDVTGASFTTDGTLNVEFRAKQMRINVAGGLGSASINAIIY